MSTHYETIICEPVRADDGRVCGWTDRKVSGTHETPEAALAAGFDVGESGDEIYVCDAAGDLVAYDVVS